MTTARKHDSTIARLTSEASSATRVREVPGDQAGKEHQRDQRDPLPDAIAQRCILDAEAVISRTQGNGPQDVVGGQEIVMFLITAGKSHGSPTAAVTVGDEQNGGLWEMGFDHQIIGAFFGDRRGPLFLALDWSRVRPGFQNDLLAGIKSRVIHGGKNAVALA